MLVKTPPASSEDLTLPDGRMLGYAEYGAPDGLPLIGFHGTPGSRFMFRLAHRHAAELGLRLLAPERPGFGLSAFHRGHTLSTYAADIAAFADALGVERFAVAGVSGGAPCARCGYSRSAGTSRSATSRRPPSSGRGRRTATSRRRRPSGSAN